MPYRHSLIFRKPSWSGFAGLAATLAVLCSYPVSAELAAIEPGSTLERSFTPVPENAVFRLLVSIRSGNLSPPEKLRVQVSLADGEPISKILHAGDPDLWLALRAAPECLSIRSEGSSRPLPVQIEGSSIPLAADERPALEVEPDNDWRHANALVLGRDVYGSADDVDYLHNENEGQDGLDWFRLEIDNDQPTLVFFHLDLTDRDVSADLRLYTLGENNRPQPFETGKDPMETIHDRERVRYSTHLSRVLSKGTYYLRVNANHPFYVLRTRRLPLPPYDDPRQAVDVGLHYLQETGDAWFSQIPREGNRTVRSVSLHETATRCTACHAAAFPLDATLWAHQKGYPVRDKPGVQYLDGRLRASITPLPGPDGLNWQRYIATPLESQGFQGGLVARFDRQISGLPDESFNRFVPFLRAAWASRTSLPEDERNGVIPLDSKFELAWRDWQVLTEAARRDGDRESSEAAKNIERLVADPASDLRIETFQDRLHRLLCWWMFDPEANSSRILDESEAIFRLQNPDGGWHETDGRDGPSSDYATGQVVWTLLQVGASPDDPRIRKAARYLLARQQTFGGWFQTETHENFSTPMRETRFAVMALASVFPNGGPLEGWGNGGKNLGTFPMSGRARLLPSRETDAAQQEPRPPEDPSVVAILDELEDLWDRPEGPEGDAIEHSVAALLDHPEPLVRARSAACLGRIGGAGAASPLVGCLDDPCKIVVRAASESLRRLGRWDLSGDLLVEALASPDPLMRRGAAFVFTRPFPGLDGRRDLATRLLLLSDDPDLWTRLAAIRGLRQWFYRTSDPAFQRRVVFAFLSRMAHETEPVLLRNLSQNLYIIFDENLGGGVSLQKNLEALPEPLQARVLAARGDIEQRVLLGPVLSALASSGDRQRDAILASFDGSSFSGRTYARRPSNQVDVGNDRDFGFLTDPPLDLLEKTFTAVFSAETRPLPKSRAIELAEFFRLPGRTSDPALQSAFLEALLSPEPSVREAAGPVVASSLSLRGLDDAPVLKVLDQGDEDTRKALAQALARTPELLTQPAVWDRIDQCLEDDEALFALLPVLSDPSFAPDLVLKALGRGRRLAASEDDRLALLRLLGRRLDLLDAPDLPATAEALIQDALSEGNATARRQALSLLDHRSSRERPVPSSLVIKALSLSDPEELMMALSVLEREPDLLGRAGPRTRLLQLLIDPSPPIRSRALDLVEAHGSLLNAHPTLARRVRALMDDPGLGDRAASLLRSVGLDPASLAADTSVVRQGPPSYSVFRDRVNPIFYQTGKDGFACADCHVNHAILRLADADSADHLTEDEVQRNYASALRAASLSDPSSSLLLRKPTSPPGQGDPDPDSPTGLTHIGGTRWPGRDHPAYQEILNWLRQVPQE